MLKQKRFDGMKLVASIETTRTDTQRMLCSLNGKPLAMKHWRDDKHDDDGGNEQFGYRPQDGRQISKEHLDGLQVCEGVASAWDDVTGEDLNPELVRKARETEME